MMVLSTIYMLVRPLSQIAPSLYSTHLLQLLVLQVASNHHLQYYEELAIADVAVAVDVVYAESESQLLLLVALATES